MTLILKHLPMSKFNFFKNTFFGLSCIMLVLSCGSSKKTPSPTSGMTEIKVPLSGPEYKTDKEYYRVVAQGTSPDISLAESIAMSKARTSMASQIQTLVQSVTRSYAEQIGDQNSISIGTSFQTMSTDVVKQVLPNISVKDSKMFKSETNNYEYWVCVEVSKKDIMNRATQQMSANKELKIENNREAFQKIFESEMNKLGQ
jgi:hypothetical protein